jgi:division protein CdvB (Snf7/Vps24/ESCRT-III family)
MCRKILVNLIDFDELTDQQRKQLDAVKNRLQERKKTLQASLDDVNQGLQLIEKKSKR